MSTTRPRGSLRRRVLAGRILSGVVIAAVTALVLAGCRYEGLPNLPLPFRAGTGDGSYEVTVHMAQLANLPPQAEVKVDDITVGTVTGVAFDDWHARLRVELEPSAVLPANATARVAQKSLLGTEYLQMSPPRGAPPVGRLRQGDVIGLERTGRYPESEELLAALSVVLNGGGLSQIQTITTELNQVVSGRQGDIRALIGNLGRLVAGLDAQKGDIIRAVEGLDRLSGTLAAQRPVLERALERIPPGLAVLARDRDQLTGTLRTLGDAGDELRTVVRNSGDDVIANVNNLQPVLGRLADAGRNLTESVSIIGTYPFPSRTFFPSVAKGDYANVYVDLDIDPATLAQNLLGGFRLPDAGLYSLPPVAAGLTDPARLFPTLPELGR